MVKEIMVKLFISKKLEEQLKSKEYNNQTYLDIARDKIKSELCKSDIEVSIMDETTQKQYNTFNGYVEENNKIICYVSFTQIYNSKKGNTVIIQDNMPFIIKQLEKDPSFISNSNVKKILFLAAKINENNEVGNNETDSFQVAVRVMETFGYKVLKIINYKNLKLDTPYKEEDLDKYLKDIRKLSVVNKSNKKRMFYQKKQTNTLVSSKIDPESNKGQFAKFYLFRMLPVLIMGNKSYRFDFSNIAEYSNPIRLLDIIARYYKVNNDYTTPFEDALSLEEDLDTSDNELNKTSRPIKTVNTGAGKKWKTDSKIKKVKIEKENYKCIINGDDMVYFTSASTNENYVEGHHMIPMSFQGMYEELGINLDVMNNIVPLSAENHRKIHFANEEGKKEIITAIWSKVQNELNKVDPDLTLEKLMSFYNL